MVASIAGWLGIFPGLLIGALTPRYWIEQDTWKLVNMRTTEGTFGTFVLGTGSVGEETVYRVLIVNQNGSVSPFSVRATASNTTILEQENQVNEGRLTVSVYDAHPLLGPWGLTGGREKLYRYEFIVPKGSVRNEFSVQ